MCPGTPSFDLQAHLAVIPMAHLAVISRHTSLVLLAQRSGCYSGLEYYCSHSPELLGSGGDCKGLFTLHPPHGAEEGAASALTMLSSCCWHLCSCPVLPEVRTCPLLISSWVWMNPSVSSGNSHQLPVGQLQQRVSKMNRCLGFWALAPFSILVPRWALVELGTGTSLVLAGQARTQPGSASPHHVPQTSQLPTQAWESM